MEKQTFWVDIPLHPSLQSEPTEFTNVATFDNKEDAIKYAMEHFGADENGNICLVTPS